MELILTASASPAVLGRWRDALSGFGRVLAVGDLVSLNERLEQSKPQVLLLDADLLAPKGPVAITGLRKSNPATRIIVLGADVSDEMELALFKSGVRGFAHVDIDPQVLKRIVVAVQEGELWIRRRITLRLLDELSVGAHGEIPHRRETDARLAVLTNREREIAKLIGNGETNKQIARQLCITERTVKAHLTEIFRKLGIGDRLRLALRVKAQLETDLTT